ncbi:MAG: nucleotidyltransferase family protein [Clostridia bacterium]|nr:nucleotidyltransferase family protein [Clostridia bacterium]
MEKPAIVFDIIANIICDKQIAVEEMSEDDLKYLWSISQKHDVSHIISKGLEQITCPDGSLMLQKFKKMQTLAIYRHIQTEYELNSLIEIFENEGIDFIPLKGSVLRNYYPEAWLRTSCDIDILVRNQDLDKAVRLLVEKYGYTFKERGLHDISLFSKGKIHLELHFDLTSEDRYSQILSTVWEHCILAANKSHQYLMNNEFFVFYHLTHMAEHFVHGGCGIRPFIDLWVINTKMGYDEATVVKLCEQVGLSEFYFQTKNLVSVWLESGTHTSLTLEMENFVIGAGIYGTMENNIALNQGNDKGKSNYIFHRIFLPYEKLKRLYPGVERNKMLIPLYQVKRWVNFVFKKDKKRARQEIKVSASISQEKVNSVKHLCSTLGLK